MQLLTEGSSEDGHTSGLGLIRGTAERLNLPVLPHMGWNRALFVADWDGVGRVGEGLDAYFVHSYALPAGEDAAATCTEAEQSFAALVRRGNVAGTQFHPERSGEAGLALLDRMLSSLGGTLVGSSKG
jgi:glutamine amidotransferase